MAQSSEPALISGSAESTLHGKEYRELHAEWYDLISGRKDQTAEIDYWARKIQEAGEPALELGSGTGRVMVPLLARNLKVKGIDTSDSMTERLQAKCRKLGLTADIYAQSMLDFELPFEFGLIFLDSGGLSLFQLDTDIASVFSRVHHHLVPGGVFIYEFQTPPKPDAFQDDSRWFGDWASGDEGQVIAWRQRRKYDPERHIWEMLFVIEKFVDGALVRTEVNERSGRRFPVDEAIKLATSAGFVDVQATDWLTESPPHEESGVVTIQCRKA